MIITIISDMIEKNIDNNNGFIVLCHWNNDIIKANPYSNKRQIKSKIKNSNKFE